MLWVVLALVGVVGAGLLIWDATENPCLRCAQGLPHSAVHGDSEHGART